MSLLSNGLEKSDVLVGKETGDKRLIWMGLMPWLDCSTVEARYQSFARLDVPDILNTLFGWEDEVGWDIVAWKVGAPI